MTLLAALGVALAALASWEPSAQAQPAQDQPAQDPPAQDQPAQQAENWTHYIEISVPFRDANGDGVNDYNPQFTIDVSRDLSSGTVGSGECPAAGSPSQTPSQTSASIVRSGPKAERFAATSDSGYDQMCVLVVGFPASVESGVSGITLELTSSPRVQTAAGASTARATYSDGRQTFRSDLTFDNFTASQAGERFAIKFTPTTGTPAACVLHRSVDHDTYEVDAAGVAVRTAAARLIDQLPNSEGACSYDMTWPSVAGLVSPPTGARLTGASPSATGDYMAAAQDEWTHRVEISVPFRDANADGVNDYDPQFAVTSTQARWDQSQGAGSCPATTELGPRVRSGGGSEIVAYDETDPLAPGCVLATEFAESVLSGVANITLMLDAEASQETTIASPAARATYDDGRTMFEAELTVGGFTADQAGDTLEVTYHVAPSSSAVNQAECALHPHLDHEVWLIDSTGGAARHSSAASLIGELPNAGGTCAYDVEWAAFEGFATPSYATVSAAAPAAVRDYERLAVTRSVVLGIDTLAEASGATFTVAIAPVAGAHDNCDDERTVPLTVDETGTARQTITVTDQPRGSRDDDRCAYGITWPDDEDGAGVAYQRLESATSGLDATVFGADGEPTPILTRTYLRQGDLLAANLEITTTAPPLVDTTFSVGIAPSNDALEGCTGDDDHEVVVPARSETGASLAVTLVLRPLGGTTTCAYAVSWPDNETAGTRWVSDAAFASSQGRVLGVGVTTAANRYVSQFEGVLEVRTSSVVAQDTSFAVRLSPASGSPAGCSSARTVTATVRTGGTRVIESVGTLVQRPFGATADCTYAVSWPDNETNGRTWADDNSFASDVELSASNTTATHRYRSAQDTTFAPQVSVTVPPLEGLTPGENLFAGAELTLTFSREPNSDPACSADTPISVTYVVDADGEVTGEAPSVFVNSASSGPCVYRLQPDGVVSSEPGASLSWELTADMSTKTLDATSPGVTTVAYSVGDVTFTPQVTVSVPQIEAEVNSTLTNLFADALVGGGTTGPLVFDVAVAARAGSPAGCTDTAGATSTFTVQSNGTVSGSLGALRDRVLTEEAGQQVQEGASCTYEVTFPDADVTLGWLTLDETPALTETQLSATSPAARATYDNAEITSALTLNLTAPVFTPPPGRAVSVTIRAAQDAGAACLVDDLAQPPTPAASKSKMVTLEADGTTSLTEQFRLTDLPAGSTSAADRCAYDVVWPVTEEPVTDAPADPAVAIWTRTEGDVAWAASGRLGAAGSLAAVYAVPVDESFDATLNLVVAPHVPEGTVFTVTVSVDPASGSPMTGCSDVTRMLTAPAVDGNNDRTVSDTFPLVHTVAGEVQHCSYDVGWPTTVAGTGVSFTPQAGFTPDATLSQATPAATSRYSDATQPIPFDASLVVTTTENVTVQTTFVVNVAAPTTPTGCTATADVRVVVAAGTSTTTHELSLTRRPAGESSDCTYALTWQPNEDGATAWARDDTLVPDATLSYESPSAAVRYAPNVASFAPSVAFNLPPLDFNRDGSHDLAGTQFMVGFARAATETSCSADRTEAYEVAASGEVEPVTEFALASQHEGNDCVYAVTFPPTSVGGALALSSDASDDGDVSATMNDAQATYRDAVSRFTASLFLGGTHTVATDGTQADVIPAGTRFSVTVQPQRGAPAGCDANPSSAARDTTVVLAMAEAVEGASETALTRRALAGLVDRTASGAVCVYDVVWPRHEVGGTSYVADILAPGRSASRTLRSGDTDDVGAVAWYRARDIAATGFTGEIRVLLTEPTDRDLHFAVRIMPPTSPRGCSAVRSATVTVRASETSGSAFVELIDEPPGEPRTSCVYQVEWPLYESDGTSYTRDDAGFTAQSTLRDTRAAQHQWAPSVVTPQQPPPRREPAGGGGRGDDPPDDTGDDPDPDPPTTWDISGPPVRVRITVATSDRVFLPGDSAIELLVKATDVCGDDVASFDGLPAEVGVIYAVDAYENATADVLAGTSLRFPSHAVRGDQTRDCELRVTLLDAPIGCQLDAALLDAAARPYLEVRLGAGGGFVRNLRLSCVSLPSHLYGYTLPCILNDECDGLEVWPDTNGITARCLAAGTCRRR